MTVSPLLQPVFFRNGMKNFVFNHFIMVLVISSVFFVRSTFSVASEKKRTYSVQLGAFKTLDNALSMVERLKRLGQYPFYRYETIEGKGKFYIVYIGKYGSQEEAEKNVRMLRKSNIASTYLIKAWDSEVEVLKSTDTPLVIKEITYQLGKDGKEKVFIHANGKFLPMVFAIEGENPKSVIDIKDVDTLKKDQSKIPVHGELIKQIRSHLHRDSNTLRIVLDLSPSHKNYRVNQIFYETENVYALEVEVEEEIKIKEREEMVNDKGQDGPSRAMGEAKQNRIELRSKGKDIAEGDVQVMLIKYNFYSSCWNYNMDFCNPKGSFNNLFIDNGDGTVTDRATNLMWQKGGSFDMVAWGDAKGYMEQLNLHHFAGYSDWRLPTLEELTSMMECSWKNRDLFIESVFDSQQKTCWSSDTNGPRRAWKVNFHLGYIIDNPIEYKNSVRAVRSLPSVLSKVGH